MLRIDKTVIFLCSLACAGAALFYVWHFDPWVVLVIAVVLSAGIIIREHSLQKDGAATTVSQPASWILPALHLAALIMLAWGAWASRTDAALFSPFEVLSAWWLPLYAVASFILVRIFMRGERIGAVSLSLHLALSVAVTAIVYRTGYGFDPFIHEATERLLAATGTISPKPPYYVGLYSLVLVAREILRIDIAALNVWLTPLLAAALIPAYAAAALPREKRIGALALLIIPYGIFISATPQAMANIFLILLIWYALRRERSPIMLWLLAAAAAACHPLAGIPALLYAALEQWSGAHRAVRVILIAAAFGALPLALAAANALGILHISLTFDIHSLFAAAGGTTDTFPLAMLYAAAKMTPYIVVALAAVSLFAADRRSRYLPHLVLAGAMASNGLLMSTVLRIGSVAAAESAVYGRRLFVIAAYFLLPLIAAGIARISERAQERGKTSSTAAALCTSLLVVSTFYGSYPRLDDVGDSRFVSASGADLAAVTSIESWESGPYLVLANQMTSAVALRELGFSRQLPAVPGQFIYPIPTGSEFYTFYDRMVTIRADKKTMNDAMAYAGVSTGYFVLPHYWERYEIIAAQAKNSAQSCEESAQMLICLYRR